MVAFRTATRPRWLLAAALLAVCLVPSWAATAMHGSEEPPLQGRRLTITEFESTYTVRTDGVIEVEDRITVRFDGSWNGMYRYIPLVYDLGAAGRHRILLDLQSIEDAGGRRLRSETKREGALLFMKTWVPGANDATRTLVYKYEVENGLRYFDDEDGLDWAHDELYWNVTGDEWKMPILRARATVHAPEGAEGLRVVAYTGRRGSTAQDYEQVINGATVTFETLRELQPGEGLTVVVGWEPGLVARPSTLTRARWWFADYMFTPLPFIAFGLMFWIWRRRGKDPELGRSIMPRYEPPDDLRPAEVGTLMDFTVDARDLSATIIDLAVRGYLRIEEVPSKVRRRPKDHIIHIIKEPDAGELKEFEQEVLRGLKELSSYSAKSRSRNVRVTSLKQKFYKFVPKIKRRIHDRMVRPPKLFTARPENVIGVWVGIAFLVGVLCFIVAIIATTKDLGHPVARWVSLMAVPLAVLGFGSVMPARTMKGAWVLNHVLGLREYIDRVDRDRLKHVTLEHFETLLPYAAAMGLERKWTVAFEQLLIEPPSWYVSSHPGHFHVHSFSRSLGTMTAATGQALTTAPRQASGGSGFGGGGGGFSGGGFGGGGGGGF